MLCCWYILADRNCKFMLNKFFWLIFCTLHGLIWLQKYQPCWLANFQLICHFRVCIWFSFQDPPPPHSTILNLNEDLLALIKFLTRFYLKKCAIVIWLGYVCKLASINNFFCAQLLTFLKGFWPNSQKRCHQVSCCILLGFCDSSIIGWIIGHFKKKTIKNNKNRKSTLLAQLLLHISSDFHLTITKEWALAYCHYFAIQSLLVESWSFFYIYNSYIEKYISVSNSSFILETTQVIILDLNFIHIFRHHMTLTIKYHRRSSIKLTNSLTEFLCRLKKVTYRDYCRRRRLDFLVRSIIFSRTRIHTYHQRDVIGVNHCDRSHCFL